MNINEFWKTLRQSQLSMAEVSVLSFIEKNDDCRHPDIEKGVFPHLSPSSSRQRAAGVIKKLRDLELISTNYSFVSQPLHYYERNKNFPHQSINRHGKALLRAFDKALDT